MRSRGWLSQSLEEDRAERARSSAARPARDLVVVELRELAAERGHAGVLVDLRLPAVGERHRQAGAADHRHACRAAPARAPSRSESSPARRAPSGAASSIEVVGGDIDLRRQPRPAAAQRGDLERADEQVGDRRARLEAAGNRDHRHALGARRLGERAAAGDDDPPRARARPPPRSRRASPRCRRSSSSRARSCRASSTAAGRSRARRGSAARPGRRARRARARRRSPSRPCPRRPGRRACRPARSPPTARARRRRRAARASRGCRPACARSRARRCSRGRARSQRAPRVDPRSRRDQPALADLRVLSDHDARLQLGMRRRSSHARRRCCREARSRRRSRRPASTTERSIDGAAPTCTPGPRTTSAPIRASGSISQPAPITARVGAPGDRRRWRRRR